MIRKIDEKDIELILAEHKEYIGVQKGWIEELFNAILFIFSAITAEIHILNIPSVVFNTVFGCIGVGMTILAIKNGYKYFCKKYTKEDLLMDIKKKALYRRFTLVAVKNSFDKFPNKFLLYYDKDWDCEFFPNYPTADYDNEDNIRIRLANDLKINSEFIHLKFADRKAQTKYKPSAKEERIYEHTLYEATIDHMPADMMENSFTRDGKIYCWKTIEQMKSDQKIKEKNSEVVEFVNSHIA